MQRSTKIALGLAGGALAVYFVWREYQRTQTFALAAGSAYTFQVTGSPTGSPATAVSAQAVLAAYGVPALVTGASVAGSGGSSIVTLVVAPTAAAALTGAQLAAAAGVTSGTYSVKLASSGPALTLSASPASGVGRMRRQLRAVR